MKIKTKNAKNDVTSTVNLALQKDLMLKKPKREVRFRTRVMEALKKLRLESHYKGFVFRI